MHVGVLFLQLILTEMQYRFKALVYIKTSVIIGLSDSLRSIGG